MARPDPLAARIRLVVNADDCGYYPGVTRGIAEAIDAGAVTATGVLANGTDFDAACRTLVARPAADCGVHLNLTTGAPLSAPMLAQAARWGGRMPPGPAALARSLLRCELTLAAVEAEWQAQIDRVRAAGLSPRFLNTHEHVDLLPALRRLLVELARRNGIRWTRRLRPDWRSLRGLAALARGLVVAAGSPRPDERGTRALDCLGFGSSGRLGIDELCAIAGSIPAGATVELMCHPGRGDDTPGASREVLRYHDWDREREALCSARFAQRCAALGIVRVRYADLEEGASLAPV